MRIRRAVLGTDTSMSFLSVKFVNFSMNGLVISPGVRTASGPTLVGCQQEITLRVKNNSPFESLILDLTIGVSERLE